MRSRTLAVVAVVFSLAAVGAAWLLRPDTTAGPVDMAAERSAPGPTSAASVAARPVATTPDPSGPTPRRAAGEVKRRGGVQGGGQHDFTQQYPATTDALEQGIAARTHRILACTDVFGVPFLEDAPPVPEQFAAEFEALQDQPVVPLMVMLSDGGPDGGKVDVHMHGAPPELMDCLHEAMADMSVDSPGAEGLHLVMPLQLGG